MTSTLSRIVSVEWLAQHISDRGIVVVDVRPQDHYDADHIPGARNLDLYPLKILDSDPAAIDRWVLTMQEAFRTLGISHDDRVIFYEDLSGTSAARGVWLMEALSIGRGSLLDGGLAAWRSTGQPVSTEPASVAPSDITLSLNRDLFATAPDILDNLDSGSPARIVDTRNDLEWMQGTIPSSTHVEWTAHLTPEGTFKPLDELRALYRNIGLSPDDDVTTFCASGYRAAHTWLVLSELGYKNVRNYAPSWGEWGHRADLPIELPHLQSGS